MMSTMSLGGDTAATVGIAPGTGLNGSRTLDENRQMANVLEMHKICGVCGDKALGYNFNALTCESCKAFFRRNALRNKVFRCITAGNCILNAKTRKYCRKCRLDKCFAIGMKKDWILTEEEKLLKRRKHRNRDSLERKDADSSSSMLSTMNYCYANESDHSEPSSNTSHSISQSTALSSSTASMPAPSGICVTPSPTSASGGLSSPTTSSPGQSQPTHHHPHHHQQAHHHNHQQARTTSSTPPSSRGAPTVNSSNPNIIIVPFSLPLNIDNMDNSMKASAISKETIMNHLRSKLSMNIENATINFDAIDELIRGVNPAQTDHNHVQQSSATNHNSSVTSSPYQQYNNNHHQQHHNNIPNFETFKTSTTTLSTTGPIYCENTISLSSQETYLTNSTVISGPQGEQFGGSGAVGTTVSGDYFVSHDSMETFYSSSNGFAQTQMNYSHSQTPPQQQHPQQQTVIQELHSQHHSQSNNHAVHQHHHQQQQQHQQSGQVQHESACSSSSSSIDVIKTESNDCTTNISARTLSTSSVSPVQHIGQSLSSTSPSNISTGPQAASPSPSSSSSSGYLWKISDNVYKDAIQLGITENPLLNRMPENGDEYSADLTMLEQNRLNDINEHLTPLYLHVQPNNPTQKVINEFIGGMQYFETLVRRIIIAIKNIHSFKCMCQDDQIVLIKGSVGEIKTMLHVRFFNPQNNQCIIPNPDDNNSVIVFRNDYLKKTYGEELYQRCRAFFHSFRDDWKLDDSIINLMVMIMLFYPHRSNLKHREYIMLEYLTYCHLLQRYLEVKYRSVCDGKTIFLNLMSRIEEMRNLNEKCMDLILTLIDPKYQNNFPLTAELFDLDTRQTEPMITGS